MIALNILIGLIGLGVVVFIHEFGHLVGAKAVGIDVEAFSLGWGRKLIGRVWRGTEYRISIFPVGGYCRMKGEKSYAKALDENSDTIPHEEGSFFAAAPWKRIVALIAGPIANLLFAIVVMSIVWWIGFSTETYSNRIVLASEYSETDTPNPADEAGLQTGDRIVRMGGRDIASYAEIQQMIAESALRQLPTIVERDGTQHMLTITPSLQAESGAGYLGVFPWVDPVVDEVLEDSPAAEAGFEAGDVIRSVEGEPVLNTLEFGRLIGQHGADSTIVVTRGSSSHTLTVSPAVDGTVGLYFRATLVPTGDLNLFQAIGRGAAESIRILTVSVRSLRLLFRGVELTSAVAGPVRISYFIGDAATSGFSIGFSEGLRSVASFLALLSVILFFMNLLPIPVLDGGQIVLSTVEWIRKRPPRPRFLYRYQMVGGIIIVAILFFALFGDILFLAGR